MNKKAFTLIEILVSLALIAIIMVPAFSLMKNVLNYGNKHNDISLLNQDIQIIENMVDTYLKQSDNIDSVFSTENSANKSSETTEVILSSMILSGKYDAYTKLRISISNGSLSIETGNIHGGEFTVENTQSAGDYIKSLAIRPLPNGSSFDEASGLELRYTLEKSDQTKESINRYYFRN